MTVTRPIGAGATAFAVAQLARLPVTLLEAAAGAARLRLSVDRRTSSPLDEAGQPLAVDVRERPGVRVLEWRQTGRPTAEGGAGAKLMPAGGARPRMA